MNYNMGCNNSGINTCGKISFSKCVRYEGALHAETALDVCDDLSVQEVIEDIGLELDDINSEIDLSALGQGCLEYTKNTDGEVEVKDALLAMETKICELVEYTGMTDSNCPTCPDACSPIYNTAIECLGLDYGALVDSCGNQPATLGELLQVMINQINTNT